MRMLTTSLHAIAMTAKITAPYGSWASPVTAKFITTSGVRLGSPSLDDEDRLHWLEGRPQEKGRQAVVRYVGGGADGASERGAIDITPTEVNVRTRVHEYGGGNYAMGPRSVGGGIVYSDFASQRLYHLKTCAFRRAAAYPFRHDDRGDGVAVARPQHA